MSTEKIVVKIDKDLEEIIPMFLENREKDLGLLQEAIGSQDLESIKVIGHKLAGNAGSYGLPELGEIGSQLEMESTTGNWENIQNLLDSYISYMSKLVIEFE